MQVGGDAAPSMVSCTPALQSRRILPIALTMRLSSLSIRATVLWAIIVGMVLPALVVLVLDRHVSRESSEPVVHRNRAAVAVLAAAVVSRG